MTMLAHFCEKSSMRTVSITMMTKKGVYGAVGENIELFYEPGDWVLFDRFSGHIITNLGTNIVQWAADAHANYFPLYRESNDFLEFYSRGSSYHQFSSTITQETVLARYVFADDPEEAWEVMWEREESDTEDIVQYYSHLSFSHAFNPEDEEAHQYMEMMSYLQRNAPIQDFKPTDFEQKLSDETEEMYLRLPCDCHSHEMSVNSDMEKACLEFGYWQRGRGEDPWTWKTRLKQVFDILTTGNPFANMLILNRKSAIKLRDFLNDFIEKSK